MRNQNSDKKTTSWILVIWSSVARSTTQWIYEIFTFFHTLFGFWLCSGTILPTLRYCDVCIIIARKTDNKYSSVVDDESALCGGFFFFAGYEIVNGQWLLIPKNYSFGNFCVWKLQTHRRVPRCWRKKVSFLVLSACGIFILSWRVVRLLHSYCPIVLIPTLNWRSSCALLLCLVLCMDFLWISTLFSVLRRRRDWP